MHRRYLLLSLVGLVLLIGVGIGSFWWLQARDEAQRTLVIRVPPGTALQLAAGEEIDLFPQEIVLRLSEQDTLVIQNDDDEAITIGPYRVAPGQRFIQHFAGPGTFELVCSLHPSEQLRIVVKR
ncbi:MAG: hypothetical protein EOM24_01725 [Chloroflexia bacterium]|nr:hypothetical protein [Chloroflexia bacterium]